MRREKRRGAGYGALKLKNGWRATSASTDGVALTVLFKRPLPCDCKYNPVAPAKKKTTVDAASQGVVNAFIHTLTPEEQRLGVHGIARDPGHCNISVTAQRGAEGHLVYMKTSRKEYQRCTLQLRREREERQRRMANPLLRVALSLMRSWRTTRQEQFEAALNAQAMVDDIMVVEYVEDPWYARWRMLLWRRKRSFLMRRAVDEITAVAEKGRPVLYGMGHAFKTAHTRGAVAVPTSGAFRELTRAARSLCTRNRVGIAVCDEACSTMRHHGCQQLLHNVPDGNGRSLRDVKHCHRCVRGDGNAETLVECAAGSPCVDCFKELRDDAGDPVRGLKVCIRPQSATHTGMLVDRDKNAANNILEVLTALMHNQPRPQYLQRQARRNQRGVRVGAPQQ